MKKRNFFPVKLPLLCRSGLLLWLLGLAASQPVLAEDRDGLLFTVSKQTVSRDDEKGAFTREIDRDLILNAVLKNKTINDLDAGTADFVILIRRWGIETGQLERVKGTVEIPQLKKAQETQLKTATYHIGGHLHGTSRRHVDEMEAWKFTIKVGGKATEFVSSSSFASLDKKAIDLH